MSDEKRIIKLLEEQAKTLAEIKKLLSTKKISKSVISSNKKEFFKPKKMTVPALLLLLKEDNFFDEPKTISDISKKLEEESRNVPVTSLTLPLQRLVRSRQLGRILRNKKWSYIKRD